MTGFREVAGGRKPMPQTPRIQDKIEADIQAPSVVNQTEQNENGAIESEQNSKIPDPPKEESSQ